MDSTAVSKRISWVDWAKAFFIYLMVVGHLFPAQWQYNLIYAFHMPAFFFISGYLYHEHNWKRTCLSFGVPLVAFSGIHLLFYIGKHFLKGDLDLSNFVLRFLAPFWQEDYPGIDYVYLFGGCWFLIVLFFCRLLMGDIKLFGFIRNYAWVTLGILLVYLTIEPYILPDNPLLKYKVYRIIPSLPFILMGYLLKAKLDFSRFSWPLVILMLIFFVVISEFQGKANILEYEFGTTYPLFFINALLGILILGFLCSKLKPSHLIEAVSTGTMLILAFQWECFWFIKAVISKTGFGFINDYTWLAPWLIALLTIAILYYPIIFCIKYCPILLGKVKK